MTAALQGLLSAPLFTAQQATNVFHVIDQLANVTNRIQAEDESLKTVTNKFVENFWEEIFFHKSIHWNNFLSDCYISSIYSREKFISMNGKQLHLFSTILTRLLPMSTSHNIKIGLWLFLVRDDQ